MNGEIYFGLNSDSIYFPFAPNLSIQIIKVLNKAEDTEFAIMYTLSLNSLILTTNIYRTPSACQAPYQLPNATSWKKVQSLLAWV